MRKFIIFYLASSTPRIKLVVHNTLGWHQLIKDTSVCAQLYAVVVLWPWVLPCWQERKNHLHWHATPCMTQWKCNKCLWNLTLRKQRISRVVLLCKNLLYFEISVLIVMMKLYIKEVLTKRPLMRAFSKNITLGFLQSADVKVQY